MQKEYEYAGFVFLVDDAGKLTAKPGQHSAAYKDKHRRAAQAEHDSASRGLYLGLLRDEEQSNAGPRALST